MLVQGVVVRGGTYLEIDYLVLWSREFNHSYIYSGHTDSNEWEEAMTCDWREFEVNYVPTPGPEGILTQARNLRRVKGESRNPCTTIDSSYRDVKSLRSIKSFVKHENTIKFRDTFTICWQNDRNVSGEFIQNAKINPADVGQLKKFGEIKFEAVALLTYVANQDDRSPWTIKFYIYEAKELSLHAFLAKKGHLRHGRGGVFVDATEARIPPDTLKLVKPSKPSCFYVSKSPVEPVQEQSKETSRPVELPKTIRGPNEQPSSLKQPRAFPTFTEQSWTHQMPSEQPRTFPVSIQQPETHQMPVQRTRTVQNHIWGCRIPVEQPRDFPPPVLQSQNTVPTAREVPTIYPSLVSRHQQLHPFALQRIADSEKPTAEFPSNACHIRSSETKGPPIFSNLKVAQAFERVNSIPQPAGESLWYDEDDGEF